MSRQIDWPAEDIELEICWNGDPDNCTVVAREFLPEHECQYCKHYYVDVCSKKWGRKPDGKPDDSGYVPERDDRDADETCEDWEWDEDLEHLREEPEKPKREDYRTERAYHQALSAYRKWWIQYKPQDDDF